MRTPFKMKYDASPIKQKLNSPLKQLISPIFTTTPVTTTFGLGVNIGETGFENLGFKIHREKQDIGKIDLYPQFKIENFMDSGETKYFRHESNYEGALDEHNWHMDQLDYRSRGKPKKRGRYDIHGNLIEEKYTPSKELIKKREERLKTTHPRDITIYDLGGGVT